MKIIEKSELIIRPSMSMYFGGGEIWFEQLDALNVYKDIVFDKFLKDLEIIKKPSTSSFIAINLNETMVDSEISETIVDSFCNLSKPIRKVVFVGLDKDGEKLIKKSIKHNYKPFPAYKFINDYEKAKEWLIGE